MEKKSKYYVTSGYCRMCILGNDPEDAAVNAFVATIRRRGVDVLFGSLTRVSEKSFYDNSDPTELLIGTGRIMDKVFEVLKNNGNTTG